MLYFYTMAILKFRVYWEEDDSVYRDIVIKHNQTFLDFHKAILESYDFDKKHQATFFRSNDNWAQGREITLEKYDKAYKAEPLLMDSTNIGTESANPSQKFIYLYDFTKNWQFMVELIGVSKNEEFKVSYPSCARKEGIAPQQYGAKSLVNKSISEVEEKYDVDEGLDDGFGMEDEDGNAINDGEANTDENF
jgi:hypothetical protein